MAERLRWWVIPGSLVVLARVVTLPVADESAAAVNMPHEAVAFPERAVVQDASGTRSGVLDFATVSERAFVIRLPVALAGQRGHLQVWRRIEGAREATPWLTLQPRVRDDGTLPMTGLQAGRYDLELRLGSESFHGSDVVVPGTWAPAALAAPVR